MYAVVFKHSRTIAARFLEKKYAVQWFEDNNFDDEGNNLDLFEIVKLKD